MRERLRAVKRAIRTRRDPETEWRAALPEEVSWWADWFDTKGADWPWDYEQRLDPDLALDEELIVSRIPAIPGDEVSILDVGAGPLTWLGKRYPGRRIKITPVDPLGDHYDEILGRAGIDPPVRTLACAGEDLLERFEPDSFDIAFSRNALDHSIDPTAVISNMVELVKPGGFVLLRHFANEGAQNHYVGLHGWNFDARDGDCIVWRGHRELNVTETLGDRAQTESWREGEWHLCAITKA